MFTRRLREGIRRGRIRCSVRIWARRQVKVGGRYPMDDGHIIVDSIDPIAMREVTGALARESGFESRNDLLQVAKHGKGSQVFLIRFHYVPPGAWDTVAEKSAAGGGSLAASKASPRRKAQASRSASAPLRGDGFALVRKLGLALPSVEESTSYGKPSLTVGGKMFACLASHRSAEPDTLVVRVDFDQRDELLADDPRVYYLTDHYVDYPCVLVRLGRIHPDSLRDLLSTAWRFRSTTGRRHAAR